MEEYLNLLKQMNHEETFNNSNNKPFLRASNENNVNDNDMSE